MHNKLMTATELQVRSEEWVVDLIIIIVLGVFVIIVALMASCLGSDID